MNHKWQWVVTVWDNKKYSMLFDLLAGTKELQRFL